MDAGSSAGVDQPLDEWSVDPDLSSFSHWVTLPQDVSLQLPPGSGDVLLTLSPARIWLDSVRTE
jgi:hypothetical protein